MKSKFILYFLLSLCISLKSFAITLVANTTSNNGSGGIFLTLTTNTNAVNITSFNTMFSSAASTPVAVEIYTMTGAYGAFTASSTGWTLLGTVNAVSAGTTVLAPINVASLNIMIPASTTQSFYLHATTTGGGIRYFGTGTTSVTNFNDANLALFSDVARTGAVAFGGTANTPRAFTGEIEYTLAGPACNIPTGLAATGVTATTANISWTAVPSSLGYEYAMNSISTPPATGTATTTTTYTPPMLTPNTTYYFHVRNKCSSTIFSAWTTISFTTDNNCVSPTNIMATLTGTKSANISWDAMPGSIGYEYVISNTATSPSGAGTSVTNNNFTANGLMPNTSYYVHVRNKCGASSFSTWKNIPFTTPDCPTTQSIDIVNITGNSADLVWSPVSTANGYQYLVNNTRSHPANAIGATSTTSFIVNLKLLMPATKYYVHVRSHCYANDSSAWQLDSFTTTGICAAPDVQLKKTGTDTVEAKWTSFTEDKGYQYSVRQNNIPPVYGVELPEPMTTIVMPDDNMPYYLHVRRKCDGSIEYSAWSTVRLREGNTTHITGKKTAQINVYPNPVKDKLMIVVSGNADESAHAMITNLSGQILSTMQIRDASTEIDMTAYPAGMYFVKYTDASKSQVIKIGKQ